MSSYYSRTLKETTPLEVYQSGEHITVKLGDVCERALLNFPASLMEKLIRLAEPAVVSEAMDRLCPMPDPFIGHPLAVGSMDLNTAKLVINRETMRLSEE